MKAASLVLSAAILGGRMEAQTVLFDFDNAPAHSPLPISLTVAGITAQFSGTGQGFSIQPANTLGFTPAGFAGNCIYPDSVFAADLHISFSANLTGLSLLYAPEEYACDDSATLRVTAYLNDTFIGTATTNAVAGTWPSETLRIASAQAFNRVVVHYDRAPTNGGDYGPIFMADNLAVTPAPPPILLANPLILANGAFQFDFTNAPDTAFTVLSTTNVTLPLAGWTLLGTPLQTAPGSYQFTDLTATNSPWRFYCVRSP